MRILGTIASSYVQPIYKFWTVADYVNLASTDGISWDLKLSNDFKTVDTVQGMAGGPLYVANNNLFYNHGFYYFNTSTNGTTWTFINNNGTDMGVRVLYQSGKYITVISSNQVATSTDFATWELLTMPSYNTNLYCIEYRNSTYVVGGLNNTLFTSTDAITWTSRTSGLASTDTLRAITYGDKFVVVGSDTNTTAAVITTSTDGTTWTSRTSASGWNALRTITYDSTAGRYVASGSGGNANGFIAQYSTDGITWSNSTTGYGATLDIRDNGINSNAGTFVACPSSIDANFWTSTDGNTWTTRTNPDTSGGLHNAVYFDSKWWFSRDYSTTNTSVLMHTTNFTTWTWITTGPTTEPVVTPTAQIGRVNLVNGNYTVINPETNSNSLQSIGVSTNFTTWTFYDVPISNTWNAIIYGNGTYALGGSSGRIYTSTNLTTWTSRTANFGTSTINGGVYGNSLYVFAGNNGRITTSTDAVTWTSRTSNFGTSAINNVRYLNNLFIASGNAGKISTSTDAITWTSRTSGSSNSLRGLEYAASTYVCVGDGNTIITSTNATTWSVVSNPGGISDGFLNWYKVEYNDSKFVVTGGYGGGDNSGKGNLYLTSTNGTTWTSRRIDKLPSNDVYVHVVAI